MVAAELIFGYYGTVVGTPLSALRRCYPCARLPARTAALVCPPILLVTVFGPS
ncbi:uncharacterized protein FIBRA_04129 [Fibroporia radiculosa]|uniref:Uncharacterized protein n=1 Tax=Fibroporia radiculosa TaxID=599839 RepID=J4G6V8_9APHY|nr:uncharacterized protein FIBRA_04129 [Fibroporia radiculosa]CCM02053.1 predicted protein [Fibroporia radiculosa]